MTDLPPARSESPRPLTRCKPNEHRWVYTRPEVGGVGYVCEKCGAVRVDDESDNV